MRSYQKKFAPNWMICSRKETQGSFYSRSCQFVKTLRSIALKRRYHCFWFTTLLRQISRIGHAHNKEITRSNSGSWKRKWLVQHSSKTIFCGAGAQFGRTLRCHWMKPAATSSYFEIHCILSDHMSRFCLCLWILLALLSFVQHFIYTTHITLWEPDWTKRHHSPSYHVHVVLLENIPPKRCFEGRFFQKALSTNLLVIHFRNSTYVVKFNIKLI